MTRVVIGNFGGIVGMGMRAMLAGCDCEVVAEEPDGDSLPELVARTAPDVVLLDEDHCDGGRLAAELSRRFPAVAVVATSSARPQMRVFPPHRAGRPYVRPLDPAVFAQLFNDHS